MLTDYYTPYSLYNNSAGVDDTATTAWTLAGTYQGFIQPVGGGEQYRDGKSGEQGTHRLYTAVSVSIAYGDKVTWQGQDFKVLYSIQPAGISSRSRHKEILLGLFE